MSELALAGEYEGQSNLKDLTLLSGVEFFHSLAADLSKTGRGSRAAILTMDFEPSEPLVKEVMKELGAAADRGTDITFGLDAYAFLVNDGEKTVGPLFAPLPFGQEGYKTRRRALDELASKPTVQLGLINKPDRFLRNPFAHRSHIKTAVVDDKVYLGGPNFHKSDRADMVISLEDTELADWLYGLSKTIVRYKKTSEALTSEDQSWELDNQTTVLVDSGQPGQSLILDEALHLIDEANEKIFASFQFLPTGEIAEKLLAAHNRGVDVKPFHNHHSKYNPLLGIHQRIARLRQSNTLPVSFFDAQLPREANTLHSKALANEKTAMVGSHNYIELGVRYGTPEITILRNDPYFARKVGNLLMQQACYIIEAEEQKAPEAIGLVASF